jgi:uncharacterized repeat protein (TIGR03847 family)
MSDSFDYLDVGGFTAGTVGPAGERVFYLQARTLDGVVSLKLEKGQVQALATAVDQLLERVEASDSSSRPPALVEPIEPVWAVAALGVGWDVERERLVIVAQELVDEEDEDADPAEGRFHLTSEQARGFVDHAVFLVEYGRDFGRQNGHKPR